MLLASRKTIREKAHWLAQESFRFQAVTGLVEDESIMAPEDSALSSGSCSEPTSAFDTWMDGFQMTGQGKCAAVIGCGLRDDAEALAIRGFQVTACDSSQVIINWWRNRTPQSQVYYLVADPLSLPESWRYFFDLVLISSVLPTLPVDVRAAVLPNLIHLLQPGGYLLIDTAGRTPEEAPGNFPWPLVKSEFEILTRTGLDELFFEEGVDPLSPSQRHFRALYQRPVSTR